MKTRIIITAAAIIFSISLANAGSKQSTLTFRDSFGRVLTMPMMAEETPDSTPFDTKAEFSRILSDRSQSVFDISALIKAEEEEELPFDLDQVLKNTK